MAESKTCHILTAVWGAWHSEIFLSLQLPTLLAAGNLPALHASVPTTYYIYTSKTDAPRFRSSPCVAALRRVLPVRIVALSDDAFRHPVETHLRIWHNGVGRARTAGAHFMPIPADMVWADGSFRSLAALLLAGKAAVYAMFVRVTYETVIEELGWRSGDGPLTSPPPTPRRLVDLALRHLHPLLAAYCRDGDHFPFHPEYVLWPVTGEGLLMRSLATTVLVFDPRRADVDHHFSLAPGVDLDEVAFIEDSDDMFGVSVTPLLKDLNWFFTRQTLDVETVGAWWNTFQGYAHDRLADVRFHFHTGGTESPAWRRAIRRSDAFVGQCRAAREMLRIGRFLRGMGFETAAQYFAVALFGGRLRRNWRWKPGPVTIFCPDDRGFDTAPEARRKALLEPGNRDLLRRAIHAHVVQGALDLPVDGAGSLPDGVRHTLDGRPLVFSGASGELRVNGVSIRAGYVVPPGDRLYVIDRPFDPET